MSVRPQSLFIWTHNHGSVCHARLGRMNGPVNQFIAWWWGINWTILTSWNIQIVRATSSAQVLLQSKVRTEKTQNRVNLFTKWRGVRARYIDGGQAAMGTVNSSVKKQPSDFKNFLNSSRRCCISPDLLEKTTPDPKCQIFIRKRERSAPLLVPQGWVDRNQFLRIGWSKISDDCN